MIIYGLGRYLKVIQGTCFFICKINPKYFARNKQESCHPTISHSLKQAKAGRANILFGEYQHSDQQRLSDGIFGQWRYFIVKRVAGRSKRIFGQFVLVAHQTMSSTRSLDAIVLGIGFQCQRTESATSFESQGLTCMVQEVSAYDSWFQESRQKKYQREMLMVILIASRKLILVGQGIGTWIKNKDIWPREIFYCQISSQSVQQVVPSAK